MKNFLLLFVFTSIQFALTAQTPERYSSVRISLVGKQMADLVRTGIETDHGQYYPGRSITTVLSSKELERVKNAGFQTETLIEDLTAHYLEQRQHPQQVVQRNGNCDSIPLSTTGYVTPENYSYGTMGGYLTYDQMLAELDKMHSLYPNLISQRYITSDSILTWEGRPIYHVKISDNPDQDEPEREVLYTALHHAREPNSASQLIFFMWYMLENYATRTDIKALVDHLEMYFVPCINVDGYIYNEIINPDGGGYWRKNRRDNGDGSYGIDLNRNYGYFWGDFGGSSPDPFSEIYRGPSAFSEPESRTIRDFCREHDFLFVYNYHTSGNLFIYPWAYSDSPADSAFIKYARHFTRENDYHYGTTSETVGYSVNGSSDDWIYGELGAYSFTPEVGTTGFWPMPDEIDQLNKDNLFQNLSMAYSALQYGDARDLAVTAIVGLTGNIQIELTRYGLLDGPITVTLEPFSSNISSTAVSQTFDLDHLARTTHLFNYQLDASVQDGESVLFLLKTDNGFWVKTDTLRKVFGLVPAAPTVAFQDNLDNAANWSGDWSITDETFHSASTCMTDSPFGPYLPDQSFFTCHSLIGVNIPVDASNVNLRFYAKWEIEAEWDFVQVIGAGQNNLELPLCGRYTKSGVNVQPDGPVFEGFQSDWVEECMDLSAFIGQTVNIDFVFGSDGLVQYDGFYFDDVRIEYSLPTSGTQSIALGAFQLFQSEPNPASDYALIQWKNENITLGENANLLIFNDLGELVLQQMVDLKMAQSARIDTRPLAPGIYSYLLKNEQFQTQPMKIAVMR